MKPTEILKQEHRVIERVLDALDAAVHRFRTDDLVDAGLFLRATEFIRGFADGCHHQKEEGVLFPAMAAAGIPSEGGPIGVMLAEHETGRQLTRAMHTAAEDLASGEAGARDQLLESTLQYIALLRQHILKEDNILFPMADRAITGKPLAEMSKAFDRIEQEDTGEGVHERFLALAERIERESVA